MNKNPTMDRLRDLLLTQSTSQPAAITELAIEIANDPAAIAELDAIITAFTGEPATLQARAARLLAYQSSRAQLGAYVEAEIAGQNAATLYPQLADHLQTYPPLYQEYTMLIESLKADAQGDFGPAPSAMNFAVWRTQQHPAPTVDSLWQQLRQGVNRLIAEIPVWLEKGNATFGELPAALAPQLAQAPVYRQRTATQAVDEALITTWTLPLTIDNRSYKLRFSAVAEGRATLVLEVDQHQAEPAQQVRVTLNDQVGDLLESTTTSAMGLVSFRDLEPGDYQIQVEVNGQVDEFAFSLNER